MSNVEELIELIKEDVIPDIEDYMDELFAVIADKKNSAEDIAEAKERLEDMRELKSDFQEMLLDAINGDIEEDEANEIIDEIHEMMGGEEEA